MNDTKSQDNEVEIAKRGFNLSLPLNNPYKISSLALELCQMYKLKYNRMQTLDVRIKSHVRLNIRKTFS